MAEPREVALTTINKLHSDITESVTELSKAVNGTMKMAREAGRLLSNQKAAMKHGEWMPWVVAHLDFDLKTAQRYMKAYEAPKEVSTYRSFLQLAEKREKKPAKKTQKNIGGSESLDAKVQKALQLLPSRVGEIPVADQAAVVLNLGKLRTKIDRLRRDLGDIVPQEMVDDGCPACGVVFPPNITICPSCGLERKDWDNDAAVIEAARGVPT